MKYLIEDGTDRAGEPTDLDWQRIILHARIFDYVDALIAIRSKNMQAHHLPAVHETQLPALAIENRLGVSIFLQRECELLSISFRISKADLRYLTARFDIPVSIDASQTIVMRFYAPTENRTNCSLGRVGRDFDEQHFKRHL